MPNESYSRKGAKAASEKPPQRSASYDYYQTKGADVMLADFDIRKQGEKRPELLAQRARRKVDIHTRSGLDKLIDLALPTWATISSLPTWALGAALSLINGSMTFTPNWPPRA